MNRLLLFIFILQLGCQVKKEPKSTVQDSVPLVIRTTHDERDNDLIDSLVTTLNTTEFLKTHAFNGGVARRKPENYKPIAHGYYYHSYLPTIDPVTMIEGSEQNDNQNNNWFNITTYHYGSNTLNIENQKSILIDLEAYEQDPKLNGLNLIGKNLTVINKHYPNATITNREVEIKTSKYIFKCIVDNQNNINWFSLSRYQ